MLAEALDGAGNRAQAETWVQVIDPADTESPLAALTSPENSGQLTEPTEVLGSATDTNFSHYTLALGYLTLSYAVFTSRTLSLQRSGDCALLRGQGYKLNRTKLA